MQRQFGVIPTSSHKFSSQRSRPTPNRHRFGDNLTTATQNCCYCHVSSDISAFLFHRPAGKIEASYSREVSMQDQYTVRAVDVGYGHVKWTDGRDGDDIRADSFPSQSPIAHEGDFRSEILQRRDTVIVPVNGRRYEVGRHVRLALSGNHETEVLDENFPLSDAYAARLYGALNYMLPTLPSRKIDFLVLGLPLTTFHQHSTNLSKRYVGRHVINARGDAVEIERCTVYPQPLGSYAAYLQSPLPHHTSAPMALVVDPGYNTVDWFVCEGMVANANQSKAVERGMSGVLRAIAKAIIQETKTTANESEVVRLVDQAMAQGTPFRLHGKPVDITSFLQAGDSILEQAAQSVRNSVGSGASIDIILVSGGGAALYAPWLKRKFPDHEVVVLPDSALANVRGFHLIGDRLAESVVRSTPRKTTNEAAHV
ncbi:MAG: PRTRC system protein D [Burkholderiales bacterium]